MTLAFPTARGYGRNTVHGSGRHLGTPAGTIYKVTNLNTSGPGSLAAAFAASGPRIIIPEVSGYVIQGGNINLSNDYCYYAGQAGPAPGITLRKSTLNITADNVLIRHLRVMAGDETGNPAKDSRDCITFNGCNNVYIKNCSFFWSVDELFGFGPSQPCNDITIDSCIFAEPLAQGGHSEGRHDYGILMNINNQRRITFVDCVFAHANERYIRARGVTLEKINCIGFDMTGNAGWNNFTPNTSGTVADRETYFDCRGCMYLQPAGATNSQECIQAASGLSPNSRWHSDGTISPARPTLASPESNNFKSSIPVGQRSATPVASSGTITPDTAADAYTRIMTNGNIGHRFLDRLDTGFQPDTRILQEIIDRDGGGAPNTVSAAGGWPTIVSQTESVTTPSNPFTVAGNGYTNIENFLELLEAGENAPPVSGTAAQELNVDFAQVVAGLVGSTNVTGAAAQALVDKIVQAAEGIVTNPVASMPVRMDLAYPIVSSGDDAGIPEMITVQFNNGKYREYKGK